MNRYHDRGCVDSTSCCKTVLQELKFLWNSCLHWTLQRTLKTMSKHNFWVSILMLQMSIKQQVWKVLKYFLWYCAHGDKFENWHHSYWNPSYFHAVNSFFLKPWFWVLSLSHLSFYHRGESLWWEGLLHLINLQVVTVQTSAAGLDASAFLHHPWIHWDESCPCFFYLF